VVRGWVRVQGKVWRVSPPNPSFGRFNPYTNELRRDWFDGRGGCILRERCISKDTG